MAEGSIPMCEVHNEVAVKFDIDAKSLGCEQCPNGEKIDFFLLRKELQEMIRENYQSFKKKICPERRRWILRQTSLVETVNVWRFMKNVSENKFTCALHHDRLATKLHPGTFKLLCEVCGQTTENPLEISVKNPEIYLEILLDLIKESEYSVLNKFHLQTRRKQTAQSLLLVIYELQFLKAGEKVKIPRCVFCLQQVSFGKSTPVCLSCGHIVCFACYMNENNTECVIDRKKIEEGKKIMVDIKEYGLVCHNERHSLLNYTGNVLKLPCSHKSCENCLNLKGCGRCGEDFAKESLKYDRKNKNIIEYLLIKCEDHNAVATAFDYFSLTPACSNCDLENGYKKGLTFCKDFTILPFLLNSLWEQLLEHFKNKKIDNSTFAKMLHHKVIPQNDLKKIIVNLYYRKNKKSNEPAREILRFSSILPEKSFTKTWPLTKDNNCGFYITFKFPVILYGIIFGGCIRYHEIFGYRPSVSSNILIKIGSENKEKHVFLIHSQLENQKNLIKFPFNVRCIAEKRYKIIVNVEGSFCHGLPWSQTFPSEFKLERLEKTANEVGNNVIGGPILGFFLSNFKLLV